MPEEESMIRGYEGDAEEKSRIASYETAAGLGLGALSLNYWSGLIGDSFQDAASEIDLYVDYPLQIVGYTIRNPELLAPVTTLAAAALLLDAGMKYHRVSEYSEDADERRSVERSLKSLEEEVEDELDP